MEISVLFILNFNFERNKILYQNKNSEYLEIFFIVGW